VCVCVRARVCVCVCVCAQDVPLISLANIFQNARLWEEALTVARMAVEIAPHFVVNHFTLANVYIAMVTGHASHGAHDGTVSRDP